MIVSICGKGMNSEHMSESELKARIKSTAAESDVDSMLKNASETYKLAFKSGEVTGKEK